MKRHRFAALLPVTNLLIALIVEVHVSMSPRTASEISVLPDWVLTQWVNAPAVILRNLVTLLCERTAAMLHSNFWIMPLSQINLVSYFIFIVTTWYFVGNKIDRWRQADKHRQVYSWTAMLWNSSILCFGLLIGYAGIVQIPGRIFYFQRLSPWVGLHDLILITWSLSLISVSVRGLLGSVAEPSR